MLTASWLGPPETLIVWSAGSDEPRTMRAAPSGTHTLLGVDLDRDGLGDFVASGWAASNLDIRFGNGAGGIRTTGSRWPLNATDELSSRRGYGLDVGFLDGDSIHDIAVADGKRVVIFRGQPNGSFQSPSALAVTRSSPLSRLSHRFCAA